MSSISATSSSNYLTPLQQLQAELQSEVNTGAVSSSDQNALSSALNGISSALQSGSGSAAAGNASSGNSSPGDIQSKINSLIANEVSSGNLTQQQAAELQGVFQNAFGGDNPGATASTDVQGVAALSPTTGPDGAGGPGAGGPAAAGPAAGGVHHGHGGHGGAASASNASASNSTSSTSSTSSPEQILQQFLQSLQSSNSPTTYNASGSAAPVGDNGSSLSSFLINYQT